MAASPTVIRPLTLPALLDHILSAEFGTTPTTLIVCSSREAFVHQLLHSFDRHDEQAEHRLRQWTSPTLHSLLAARHVNITFCASVQTLLAYLNTYHGAELKQDGVSEGSTQRKMVLVNPLGMHAPTPSFSAQGLSRTFAAAVDTALRVHATLVVVECQRAHQATNHHHHYYHARDPGADIVHEHLSTEDEQDPWEQEVSVLNVSATKFGSGGADRAWAGRTVRVKRIAGRWFRFCKLENPNEHEGSG